MTKLTFELEYEVADKITYLSLKDYRDSLAQSLENHIQNGEWMHPDDVKHARAMIWALEFVMKDYDNGEND